MSFLTACLLITESMKLTPIVLTSLLLAGAATAQNKNKEVVTKKNPHARTQTVGVVPGQLIVKFKKKGNAKGIFKQLEKAGINLTPIRELGDGSFLVQLDEGSGLSLSVLGLDVKAGGSVIEALDKKTRQALDKLNKFFDIEYAEPNYVFKPAAVPNDQFYSLQWHLPKLNLPKAWDYTKGSNVVVAVLDTGQTKHPDLMGNYVAGYDMLSDPKMGGDGNGRDSDPTDVGDGGTCDDGFTYENSWHGTHVDGIIAASTNNTEGVSGVGWSSKIQNVRVLGKCGGSMADIADGIRWAAGMSVPGMPANTTPAKVINMSLGGYTGTACPVTYQSAINDVVARGVTVVVAAGNDGKDASGSSPANCNNVIAVTAVNIDNTKTYYGNFGSKVTLAAAGGDTTRDDNNDGYGDGILSALWSPDGSEWYYAFMEGTSMATPQVSGVVALMYSLKPKITPAQVKDILRKSATALPACTQGCGAGLLNAGKALELTRALP